MPRRLNLPDSAAVATPDTGGKLHAPSAARNAEAIADLLAEIAPQNGAALELASGTGQHAVTLAARLPGLHWQPTEINAARRASIDAYAAEAGLSNLAPAISLDATAPGWGADHTGKSLIVLINLLHLISAPEARTLITEAANALASGGLLMIYGPFLRDEEFASDGDAAFHQSLRAQDPDIGYKSDFDVLDWGMEAGLEVAHVVEMPANNLSLVWRRPS
ncbi:Protein of unknown function [Salinihabitans flavidus]|uniref:Methyltransferase domain-containing protein n=1 Tax=Salinihabitans flavidus TaxID=569882 RepID=A0A1H8LMI0_9RHOB|nr:DUF938 domain-containing protein [Salinihabitans flavidus]SEO06006.1 Protein of unknown function [Salinihabitans flavidus]